MDKTVGSWKLATLSADGVSWLLRRNCSVTPAQMASVFLSLCLVSVLVSLFFWFRGATLVLPFAVLELTGLAVALVVFARHATDREYIRLMGDDLVVEQESAGRCRRSTLPRSGLRVSLSADGDRLVELRWGAGVVHVGRYLRSELRPVLVQELRLALAGP